MLNPAQSRHLDLIRGVAAQLVLLQHAFGYFAPHPAVRDVHWGALGVLAFFSLSGYLITATIHARVAAGHFSLTEFSIGRFSRIFTPYVPAVVLVAVLDHFASRSPGYEYAADYTFGTAVANLFMLQDFPLFQILRRLGVSDQPWFFKSFGSGGPFWTVSIEWWIYAAAGLGTYVVLRGRKPSAGLLLLLLAVLFEPLYHFVGGPGNSLTGAWLFGAAAYAAHRRWTVWRRAHPGHWLGSLPAPACAGAVLLAVARLAFNGGRIYDPVFAALLAAALFLPLALYADDARSPPVGRLRLDKLAFHSYSLYLTHAPILTWLYCLWGEHIGGWRDVLLAVAGCNLFAVLFARVFEAPHRHVRATLLEWVGRVRHRGLQNAAP